MAIDTDTSPSLEDEWPRATVTFRVALFLAEYPNYLLKGDNYGETQCPY